MKFLKYISIAVAALMAFSCQETDKMQAAPAEDVVAPVMNPHSDITIDEDTLNNEVTFSWNEVDYGYPAAVSYCLFAVYGDNEIQLGESYTTSYTMTKEALNNALVNTKTLAVPEDATTMIYLYVTSTISASSEAYTKRSDAVSVNVTTIKSTSAPWIRRPLYVAGNYQGWAPDKAPIIWETAENSDRYEGLVYLGNAAGTPNYIDDNLCHFKFCPNPNWTGNLGGDPKGMTTEGDPAHITVEEGMYWLTVELTPDHLTGTVSWKKVEKIGVIGTAVGGWETDLDMTLAGMPTDPSAADYADRYYAAMCGQTWEAIMTGCQGGEFKYRLNGAWDTNWGGTLEHLVQGGDNLNCSLTGNVRFTINFRGDVGALAEDTTNPSPISGTVEQAE